jgi:hypothetical protein
MKWISNNDPPLYVRKGDLWYNQKDKCTYNINVEGLFWWSNEEGAKHMIAFPKKTKIFI